MQGGYIRQERPYVTFAALFVSEKREKKKSYFMLKITPHPPLSRSPFCPCLGDADRVRLRESVNSPLEKAGKMP